MKRKLYLAGMSLLIFVLVLSLSGCPAGGVEIGPIRFTAPVGGGTFPLDLFLSKLLTLSHEEQLCDMPSENELEEQFLRVGEFDLRQFLGLTRLSLIRTTVTATSGDFSYIDRMRILYHPASGASSTAPVVLGEARAAHGFGSRIVLRPPQDVDFLALIRANDESSSPDCPTLEIEIDATGVPLQQTEYKVEITVDAYGLLGV